METCGDENESSTSTSHQFTFKNSICLFCALPLDLQSEEDEKVDSNCNSLNEVTFVEAIPILCDALDVKENVHNMVFDNWRLPGIGNFVRWICCEKCYKLISELVSLQQLIVKSQNSLKENARKLENLVVSSSEEPSLEYSVNACVILRQTILNNSCIKDQQSPPPQEKHHVTSSGFPKSKSQLCPKQAVVLVKKLELSPPPQDIVPLPVKEICDEELICPSPPPLEAIETDEDAKNSEDDYEYRPIKKRRRLTGRKRGRPRNTKPPKTPGKPGRPRKRDQDPDLSSSIPDQVAKRKRTRKPAFSLTEKDQSSLEINEDSKGGSATISSTKHSIYFLSSTLSPEGIKDYLMMYNVKFCKTSTSLHCLHPECTHQEPLTGHFTDQTILRNMQFHIRFAHRSLPKKDKPEEDKPSFYYCNLCDSQIDSKLDFLEHQRQMHEEEEGGQVVPPFCFCDVCGDPGVPSGDLIDHVFSHKSKHEKDVISEYWTKKWMGPNKDILKPLIHPCDQCDKCFKCHTEVMTHRITHVPLELRLKVCEICGKGCKSEWAVEYHKKRVHFQNLPVGFECHICGKKFLKEKKRRWKEHLNRHTGEKPFQCEQCGKGFIGKDHLARHVKVMHAAGGKERVSCEFCGKVYKEDRYLRKHCLKKHRDKVKIKWAEEDRFKFKVWEHRDDFIGPKLMFPCEPCGKVFVFKSMLITHLKNRHKMFYERKEDYPWQLTLEEEAASAN